MTHAVIFVLERFGRRKGIVRKNQDPGALSSLLLSFPRQQSWGGCGFVVSWAAEEEHAAADAVAQPEVPPPPPPPKPISIATLAPVSMDPAQKITVEIKVDRAGNSGPIGPGRQRCSRGGRSFGSTNSGRGKHRSIGNCCGRKAGRRGTESHLENCSQVRELSAEQPLQLTVRKITLRSFAPVGDVVLFPGVPRAVEVVVERSGFAGPIPLKLEGAASQCISQVQDLQAGQNKVSVESLQAARTAPDGQHTLRLIGRVLGRNIEQQINVRVDRTPVRLNSLRVVTCAQEIRSWCEFR